MLRNNILKKLWVYVLLILVVPLCLGQEAELKLERNFIMPLMRLESSPRSGNINLNAPWFYWSPVIKSKSGYNTYKFDDDYLYKGCLSKDPEFKGSSTITSDAREWCFFNPHKKLGKGTWYWQYATISKSTGNEKWSEPIRFEVTGKERDFVTPSFDELKKKIGVSHPRIFCTGDKIGKLSFPKDETGLFLEKMEGMLGADDYVAKPFAMNLLEAKISNVIKTRKRLQEYYSQSMEIQPEKMAFNSMDEDLLKKAVVVIEKNLAEPNLSVDFFARKMGMSRSNLHLKLKAITGESATDFIKKIRFGKATKLLDENRYSIAEISYVVGFNSPSYFSTSFKKYFGYMPTEYLQRQNEKR